MSWHGKLKKYFKQKKMNKFYRRFRFLRDDIIKVMGDDIDPSILAKINELELLIKELKWNQH